MGCRRFEKKQKIETKILIACQGLTGVCCCGASIVVLFEENIDCRFVVGGIVNFLHCNAENQTARKAVVLACVDGPLVGE